MSSGSPRERHPAERADAAAEQGPDVSGHEAGKIEGVGDAGVERFLADVVAIIEGRNAHLLEAEHRLDMGGDRFARGRGDRGGIALAHLLPVGDAPAGRAVTVGGIVGAGLVGQRIGTNAPRQHVRKQFGGIAEQADAGRFLGRAEDRQRFLDAGRAPVEVAGLEPLLDPALLDLDGDAMRAGHDGRERLRAAHPAEAGGEDPLALEVAAEMLAAHLREGLVGALDDALRADVDPAARGHLAVHHEAGAIELVERLPIRPFGDDVGIGDEHARRILVGAEDADRLARLDEQGLVVLEPLERLDDLVEAGPIARGAADPAIDDQALRILGDLVVEIVHQHPDGGFGGPAFGDDLAAAAGADAAAVVASLVGQESIPP